MLPLLTMAELASQVLPTLPTSRCPQQSRSQSMQSSSKAKQQNLQPMQQRWMLQQQPQPQHTELVAMVQHSEPLVAKGQQTGMQVAL